MGGMTARNCAVIVRLLCGYCAVLAGKVKTENGKRKTENEKGKAGKVFTKRRSISKAVRHAGLG